MADSRVGCSETRQRSWPRRNRFCASGNARRIRLACWAALRGLPAMLPAVEPVLADRGAGSGGEQSGAGHPEAARFPDLQVPRSQLLGGLADQAAGGEVL